MSLKTSVVAIVWDGLGFMQTTLLCKFVATHED